MTIKNRIYFSFFLFVFLFVIYSAVNIAALNQSRRLSKQIYEVINPYLQATLDFKQLLTESKMYAANWVFLGDKKEDKAELLVLHKYRYPDLKARLIALNSMQTNKLMGDSLNKELRDFEQLMLVERQIMNMLVSGKDYEDSLKKLTSARVIEAEVLPMTDQLMQTLDGIVVWQQNTRTNARIMLEEASSRLETLIISLTVTVILLGMLLSNYLTVIITKPIHKMRKIINGIGNGVLEKVDWKEDNDEIGRMVQSVNNLTKKLKLTVQFAEEIGKRNFETTYEPLSDKDTFGKSLVSMRDNLRLSDEKLNEAQHIARLGNWECDMGLKFQWSAEMYSILDYDPAQIKPGYKEFVKSIYAEDTSKLLGLLTQCLNQGTPFLFECKIKTAKNNIKNVTIQAKLLKGSRNDRNKIIGIMQDITKQKKVEEALLQNNNELKKSNMELDKFVYSVSHDLRAPLSSMLGVVQITEEDTGDTMTLQHLGMLKSSIKKLDGFISDILDYSRNARMEVKKEEINFHSLLGGITDNLKYMSNNNRQADIRMDIHKNYPFYSDPGRLSIILNNLISNAIRYQQPGSETPFVSIHIETSAAEACIVVKDNGIGINKENHSKVFDMFYRVAATSTGSGLGLYIVRETISKLNGRIELESELGKGTEFRVHIPNLISLN